MNATGKGKEKYIWLVNFGETFANQRKADKTKEVGNESGGIQFDNYNFFTAFLSLVLNLGAAEHIVKILKVKQNTDLIIK